MVHKRYTEHQSAVCPQAVEVLKAERIGHGYNTSQDQVLYKQLLDQNMHFEVWFVNQIIAYVFLHYLF